MGVYTANRTSAFGGIDPETIVANENYSGAVGAEQIIIENCQNDMAIFEAILSNDFAEAVAVNEGTLLESELSAINEGTLGDFFEKIKAGLKKVWEKIKGLFKTFMAKLNNVIIRDNKKFVEKYKNEVLKKNLSRLTFKYSKPVAGAMDKLKIFTVEDVSISKAIESFSADAKDKLADLEEKISDGTVMEELLSGALGTSTTVGDFTKDAHEFFFEDEEEVEGLENGLLNNIIVALTSAGKELKDIEKAIKKIDDAFNKELKNIDTLRNKILKTIPDKDGADASGKQHSLKVANVRYSLTQEFQSASTKVSTAMIEAIKFGIKQYRAIFAKAAAYNPKTENAILVEAAGEAAEYEIDSLFA